MGTVKRLVVCMPRHGVAEQVIASLSLLSRSLSRPLSHPQVQAASDLSALAALIPSTSRLVLDPGAAPGAKGSTPAVECIQVRGCWLA